MCGAEELILEGKRMIGRKDIAYCVSDISLVTAENMVVNLSKKMQSTTQCNM